MCKCNGKKDAVLTFNQVLLNLFIKPSINKNWALKYVNITQKWSNENADLNNEIAKTLSETTNKSAPIAMHKLGFVGEWINQKTAK